MDCEEDRISNIPASLIGHILSLVPTKDAVATSVLSKWWEKHWTLITQLDFTDEMLEENDKEIGARDLQQIFINFVYGVLRRCTSPELCNFHLVCYKSYDASHVISWICTVLNQNVQDLYISVPLDTPALLPWNLFTSGTLVELSLGKKFVLSLPMSVSLPCLKVLHLDNVKLSDEETISNLIGGCPVLQMLSMSECVGKEVKVITITSSALESLELISLPYDKNDKVAGMKVVLETPNLSYFYIDSYVAQGYQVVNLHCLNQAVIDVEFEGNVDREQCESLEGLLEAISKVKVLQLEGCTMQAMISSNCQLPLFNKVIELNLGFSSRDVTIRDIQGISKISIRDIILLILIFDIPCISLIVTCEFLLMLLKNMPSLTTLTFAKGLGKGYKKWRSWDLHKDVPDCLLCCLKKIEIKKFQGKDNERGIVKYFLKNAKVLEKLMIRYDILETPRGSSTCQVEVL